MGSEMGMVIKEEYEMRMNERLANLHLAAKTIVLNKKKKIWASIKISFAS